MKVYLDNAATTPVHPKVYESMIPYLKENFGNPSSIHSFGRKVRVAVEDARETIAEFINADASEIYFVSSGTEANNFPFFGITRTEFEESGRKQIITSQAEHHCILDAASQLEKEGFEAKYIEVNGETIADPSKIHAEINDQTSLVSIIHANNETGSINDLQQISGMLDGKQTFLHTDAVQSFGKISTDVKELGVDSLSISGHKIGAPKGIGAVFVKSGTPLSPILFGGSQERNRRGGTENITGIIGLAEAVKIARSEMDDNFIYIKNLRDHFNKGINQISSNMLSINGSNNGIPHIVSLTFSAEYFNIDPEAMLMYLDINGIAASNGAACTSGTLNPSHVILASGKSIEDANGTIRFSFGVQNILEELDYTLEVIEKMVKKFRK